VNAAVIHAHPDDELLFAGGLIHRYPEWTWTLVSLTASAQAPNYPGIVLGHDDVWRILTVPEYRAWKASLAGLGLSPDVVFTHNQMGEYGHPHHLTVHAIVHELFPRVWDFYVDAPSSVGPQVRCEQVVSVPVEGKRERFVERYGQPVLDVLTAHQPELVASVFARECFTGNGAWPQ
jgi:LmbE family N-acetylglucosaminyl deacetylase